jgi:glycogen debranching enzyme
MNQQDLLKKAEEVLKYNDIGKWTRPAPDLYPHQWLWDSAFIAIGQSHYSVKRAKQEIISIFRGQWANGMIPHMVFGPEKGYHVSSTLWESKRSPYAPDHFDTSGITQPPMLAEAIVRIGKKLSAKERKAWYRKVWPNLLAYHEWLYRDRNPHAEGLVVLIHPWETGMDNTPPWMEAMHDQQKPLWIKAIQWTRADIIVEKMRKDTRQVPPDERMTTIESLMLVNVVRRLRRKQYDTERILLRSHFVIEDLFFNCILIRANTHLKEIASEINEKIPDETLSYINKAEKAIEELWDEETGQYYSRKFVTRKPIKIPTIATLMPLYAGTITKKRATQLVALLNDDHQFGANFQVPSVPISSPYFNHRKYWQGPAWINTNWLLVDGLLRYGFVEEAKKLRTRSLEMVERSGFFEYFSPIDGYGAGISPFSWTAALTIDFLENNIK